MHPVVFRSEGHMFVCASRERWRARSELVGPVWCDGVSQSCRKVGKWVSVQACTHARCMPYYTVSRHSRTPHAHRPATNNNISSTYAYQMDAARAQGACRGHNASTNTTIASAAPGAAKPAGLIMLARQCGHSAAGPARHQIFMHSYIMMFFTCTLCCSRAHE
jgi:hypothetical protein